jgi:hypothetical protein
LSRRKDCGIFEVKIYNKNKTMNNKIFKTIISILIFTSLLNTSFALEETANINWER